PNTLVLKFPPAYNAEREYCSETTRLSRIEAALAKVAGREWRLRVEVAPVSPSEAAKTATVAPAEAENGLTKARRLREDAENVPLIKRAIDLLGAQVVRVD